MAWYGEKYFVVTFYETWPRLHAWAKMSMQYSRCSWKAFCQAVWCSFIFSAASKYGGKGRYRDQQFYKYIPTAKQIVDMGMLMLLWTASTFLCMLSDSHQSYHMSTTCVCVESKWQENQKCCYFWQDTDCISISQIWFGVHCLWGSSAHVNLAGCTFPTYYTPSPEAIFQRGATLGHRSCAYFVKEHPCF